MQILYGSYKLYIYFLLNTWCAYIDMYLFVTGRDLMVIYTTENI